MRWRKATWAILIWTALMAYVLFDGLQSTQAESAERYGVFYFVVLGFALWGVLLIWFVGFLILAVVWLVSMPKPNMLIYDPQGRWMVVTEKEAKRRVEREGWTYQPPYGWPPPRPPAGPGRP